jgi:uroporphyrinogen-III decarboxylase
MKSLFKVTLLATTMAVALNAPLTFAADTAAKRPRRTAKRHLKMTIRNPPMRWAHLWDVTWKTP